MGFDFRFHASSIKTLATHPLPLGFSDCSRDRRVSIDLAKIRSNEDGQQGLEPLFSDQDTDIGDSCKEKGQTLYHSKEEAIQLQYSSDEEGGWVTYDLFANVCLYTFLPGETTHPPTPGTLWPLEIIATLLYARQEYILSKYVFCLFVKIA